MKFTAKKLFVFIFVIALVFVISMPAFAAGGADTAAVQDDPTGDKAIAAAVVVGLAAAAGAIGMGIAIAKALESIARQPEAEGKIRTTLMLGLVFVETAIIYALVVGILVIFVL